MHVFVHSIIRLNYHEFSYLLIFNITGKQYIQHAIIFWSHKEVRIYLSIEDLTERCGNIYVTDGRGCVPFLIFTVCSPLIFQKL